MKLNFSCLMLAMSCAGIGIMGQTSASACWPTQDSAATTPENQADAAKPTANKKSDNDDFLTVGSKAPAIDVKHWVHDGEGAFKPVKNFEDGQVYLVEFWATWCGPCLASMPHIVETQEKYKDQGFQVISISDEDLETVQEFLELPVGGETEKTFGDLTKSYCLTTDPDRSVLRDYMEAAGQSGIPTAFLVGKTGVIEWIGHPMQMDQPLAEVIADKWDRERFAAEFKPQQENDIFMMKISRKLGSGDIDGGLAMLDKKIESLDDSALDMKRQLASMKLSVLMQTEADEKTIQKAVKQVLPMFENPMELNNLTWSLSEMATAGKLTDKAFLGELAAITEKAAEESAAEEQWIIWDTVGHLYYNAGELDKAITAQKKAVEHPNSKTEPSVKKFLQKLEAEKT